MLHDYSNLQKCSIHIPTQNEYWIKMHRHKRPWNLADLNSTDANTAIFHFKIWCLSIHIVISRKKCFLNIRTNFSPISPETMNCWSRHSYSYPLACTLHDKYSQTSVKAEIDYRTISEDLNWLSDNKPNLNLNARGALLIFHSWCTAAINPKWNHHGTKMKHKFLHGSATTILSF